jgi:exodeoxyribonuclease-3
MKIVSFNVNGLRARLHQLQALIASHRPDIIGLQETKVHDSEFPLEAVEALGYRVVYHGGKGHYGVALLSKIAPEEIAKGFPEEDGDAQRRLLIARYSLGDGRSLRVINGYFPQGESRDHPTKFPNKQNFYANLYSWLQQTADPQELLVVMGDMNVAPLDADVGIGADNAKRWLKTGKCCFLPEEREMLQRVTDWGLKDTYREQFPEVTDRFSWFDYRSKGFDREPKRGLRIDLLLATEPLVKCCVASGIDYEIRAMEKASDHCPVWAEFAL